MLLVFHCTAYIYETVGEKIKSWGGEYRHRHP